MIYSKDIIFRGLMLSQGLILSEIYDAIAIFHRLISSDIYYDIFKGLMLSNTCNI